MNPDQIPACIKVAACICALDGLISEAEEEMMFKLVLEKVPEYQLEQFNQVIDEFFDSTDQIEDYLCRIKNPEARKFTLYLSEASASADGLDLRENIALQKAHIIWTGMPNE